MYIELFNFKQYNNFYIAIAHMYVYNYLIVYLLFLLFELVENAVSS